MKTFRMLLAVVIAPLPLVAQTEPPCTVSILNKTARVRADGRWYVPNVPVNMGPVRARMTCTEGGQTRSGTSDFFTIAQDDIVGIGDIVLDGGAATPRSIMVTAPTLLLTPATGMSTQLTTTAQFPDGTTKDLSSAADGTLYAVSNSAIATVSPDGVVTGASSGVVLVMALHDGVMDTERLRILGSNPEMSIRGRRHR